MITLVIKSKGGKLFHLTGMQEGILNYEMKSPNGSFDLNVYLSQNKLGNYVLDNYEILDVIGNFIAGSSISSFDEIIDFVENNDITTMLEGA